MNRISRPRAIFDRRALAAEAAALGAGDRAAMLALARRALTQGRAEILRRLEMNASGTELVAAGALLMDQVVRLIHDFASAAYPAANPTAGERLAIVAVGGYGRGELAPHSDIDLLFLRAYKPTPRTEQIVETMLYLLWDLGLKVGHAVRSVDECLRLAREDHVVATSLLDARHIAGDRRLANELKRRFTGDVIGGTEIAFVEAKLAERDKRHARMGDSRYVLEPNIKDGKGGLRDLHTLLWIAKALYRIQSLDDLAKLGVLTEKEVRRFAKAQNFLWTLRCHLHVLAGRAGDMLTFDVQTTIARRLGYTDHAGTLAVERFMKHYFLTAKTVGDLTRILCAVIASERKRAPHSSELPLPGFALEGDRIAALSDDVFERDPVNLLRLFHAAHEGGHDIHPKTLALVTRSLPLIDAGLRQDAEANRLFMEMLTARDAPDAALRKLNEAGVLGRFVPDFGRVVAQMQHDMYHVYTVDEHTIRAIGILSRIERGTLREDHPLSSEIIHKVLSRRVLYAAVLLHDIAKGRGGNHPELGGQIAERLCPRFGLSAAETETVAWLVRWHLVMSETAFKRDLSDPQALADFVAAVQSPERLRLLLILTVCDIRAVGPSVWNGWKAALLRDIYFRAERLMTGGLEGRAEGTRLAEATEALMAALPGWTKAEVETHLARLPSSYALSLETETLARHARLLREAELTSEPVLMHVRVDEARAVTEVVICAKDAPGLFARLTGALSAAGADIVDARIVTTADGRALDTFWIQDGTRPFDDPFRLRALRQTIERSLAGTLDLEAALARRRGLPERAKAIAVPARVFVNEKASATHTVVEVNGRDRPGLLYDIARAFADLKLQVSSAKISTYGERVVDVFYVKDSFGLQVTHPKLIAALRERLMAVIAGPAPAATGATAAAE